MRRLLKYILSVVTIISVFDTCAESDDFSSDPDLKLTFSCDTVRFDTVFTTIGSSTNTIQIYNRNNKSLRIESIEIMNPHKSGFQMIIDGESGTRLKNIDILKKDSLYGFLRVTIDPLNINNPLLIRDSIRFVTNGNVQYLYLEAIGRDVYKWNKKSITADTVITAEKPILIYDTLYLSPEATLTIKEGTELYFHNKASLQAFGTLKAFGTIDKPIVFRGDRLDKMNGNVPYDNVPGQWDGIVFHPDSYNNYLENVIIKNAVIGMKFLPSDIQNKKASMINTIIHNSSEKGMQASESHIEALNCQFTNARKALIDLSGGKYLFLHNTIANYYIWTMRVSESVKLRDKDEETNTPTIFAQCDFVNSIIYGSVSGEISIPDNADGQNFKFTNCLIKSLKEYKDSHFVDVLWNQNPQFKDINKTGNYHYDFSILSTSPAIGKADKTYSSLIPFDIKGNSRLEDGNPDLGCYEQIEE